MNPIDVEINVTDAQGVVVKHKTQVEPIPQEGGEAWASIPGVARMRAITESYDVDSNIPEMNADNMKGYSAGVSVKVWLDPAEKIKSCLGQGVYHEFYKIIYAKDNTEKISKDRDVIDEDASNRNYLVFNLWDADFTFESYTAPGRLYATYLWTASKQKIVIWITLKEWSYLPVREDNFGKVTLYRSPTNGLILRDGDG